MNAPVIEAPPQKTIPAGPLLFIDSLSVSFGNQHVLRNVSLELTSGETLQICDCVVERVVILVMYDMTVFNLSMMVNPYLPMQWER